MEFLITLFAIAAIVWLVPIIRRGRLIVGVMSILVVGTIWGPQFFAIEGPIQLSLDRMLWLAMFALAAIGWRMGEVEFPRLGRIDLVVIAMVAWFFISAARGGAVPGDSSPIARWLFYIAMPAGMYGLARLVKVHQMDVRWLMKGLIALGLYLAVTAIFEITGRHQFVFPKFVVDAESWEFYGRGRGPLMNPSGNGMLISMSLVAACLAFIYAGRRGRLIYGLIVVVLMAGVYGTLTRSAWLGAVAALGLVALVYSPRWVRVLGVASVILVGGASMVGLKDQLVQLKRDKNLTAADAQKSMALRPLLAVVAWEMFKDRPIAGHGFGHYFAHNEPYHVDRSYELPLEIARPYNQHNVFLSVLVDTGLVGLSLFGGWLLMLAGTGWKLARGQTRKPEARYVGLILLGTMVAYSCNGLFQDTLIIPMLHMFLFFTAGLAVNVYHRGIVVDLPIPRDARLPCDHQPVVPTLPPDCVLE